VPTSAVLDDLIDALEMQSDSLYAFLDRETGEVEEISEEFLSLADAEPDEIDLLPDWQKEVAKLANRIQNTDRYLALPSQFDVHEWNIMNDFCLEQKRQDIRERLLGSIHGSHAFRRFKDQIADHNLWDEWNRYRRHAFAEILRDWSEENGITLTVRPERQAQPGN
jgi:hypothetical protein